MCARTGPPDALATVEGVSARRACSASRIAMGWSTPANVDELVLGWLALGDSAASVVVLMGAAAAGGAVPAAAWQVMRPTACGTRLPLRGAWRSEGACLAAGRRQLVCWWLSTRCDCMVGAGMCCASRAVHGQQSAGHGPPPASVRAKGSLGRGMGVWRCAC